MNCIKLLTIFFVTFFISLRANAESYFDKNVISPTLIEPPFADGSLQWKNEINEIIKLQKNANLEEIDHALEERHLRPEMVAQNVDASLTREKYPKLYQLLDNVSDTSRVVNDEAKSFWHTKRPYMVDKRIHPLIEAHNNPAYPSGHTCGSYTLAHILGLLIPQKRAEFQARAQQIAWHRVLVGMHFPHDLVGGQQLSLLIVGALMENSDFRKDFEKAKKELAKN